MQTPGSYRTPAGKGKRNKEPRRQAEGWGRGEPRAERAAPAARRGSAALGGSGAERRRKRRWLSERARRRRRREGGGCWCLAPVEGVIPAAALPVGILLRGSERDTHRILPPPPLPPTPPLGTDSPCPGRPLLRPPALAHTEGAAAPRQIGPPFRLPPPPPLPLPPRLGPCLGTGSARCGAARVDVVKQAQGKGIRLCRSPPGSTCSLH